MLDRSDGGVKIRVLNQAGIAQLVEHDLAKVGVASSSLVSRSKYQSLGPVSRAEVFFVPGPGSRVEWVLLAGWQSGYAAACKAVYLGSTPGPASIYPHS